MWTCLYVDAFGDNVMTLITYTLQQQQHSKMKKTKKTSMLTVLTQNIDFLHFKK